MPNKETKLLALMVMICWAGGAIAVLWAVVKVLVQVLK